MENNPIKIRSPKIQENLEITERNDNTIRMEMSTYLKVQKNDIILSNNNSVNKQAKVKKENDIDNIVKNQIEIHQEQEVTKLGKVLGTTEQYLKCPYCGSTELTMSDKKCNAFSIITFIFGGFFLWLIVQAIRKKEINCWDANHSCRKCHRYLGCYKSCF